MALKTRKQIRKDFEAVSAELTHLKTAEGLAVYLYSKKDDQEFEDAVHAKLQALEDADVSDEQEPAVEGEPEPASADEANAKNSTEPA